MRPLQAVAMGLVIVALHATVGGYDALPDPLGWALVLVGVAGLPDDLVRRDLVRGLAVTALLVSVPLWLPHVSDALYDQNPALGWAANLPQVAFCAVLADSLARAAEGAGDTRARAWFRTLTVFFVVLGLLPVLVFGGGVEPLEVPSYVAATLVLLTFIWLLFAWNSRAWASRPGEPTEPAERLAE